VIDPLAGAGILTAQNAPGKASKGRHMAGKLKVRKNSAGKKPAAKQPAQKPSGAQQARSAAAGPSPGTKAPPFSLHGDSGGTVSLADFAGHKLVLYFYPRADTTGCTKEAIDFSRLRGDFGRADTQIVGVSADPVPALAKFKAKHKLSIALASDEKHRMLEAYGVWQEKLLYGRKFLGIVRTTFLIGADGRIAKVWPKVSVDGHAAEVLVAAKAL
jgi:thioredoxin-dependent peroxiredoxin